MAEYKEAGCRPWPPAAAPGGEWTKMRTLVRTYTRRALLTGALCAALWAGGGCAPVAAPAPAPGVIVRSAGDAEISATQRGDALLIDIRSPGGIGSAEITLPESMASRDLILRLHLSGLESLRFAYAGAEVQISVGSGNLIVREEVRLPGQSAAQPVNAASDFWMDVGILSANPQTTPTLPLADGSFDVRAPRDFLRSGTRTFTVAWVDFYR